MREYVGFLRDICVGVGIGVAAGATERQWRLIIAILRTIHGCFDRQKKQVEMGGAIKIIDGKG
jgi:hypothetical protein